MQVTPWGPWGTTVPSAAGVSVSAESSLQLLTVLGCVTLISDTIATLPSDVYRNFPTGPPVEVRPPGWLEQPNPYTDRVEFITQSLWSLLLEGNAYWAYAVNQNFAPTELYVLNPAVIEVREDQGRPSTS
jgi:phage portal protein BeeE